VYAVTIRAIDSGNAAALREVAAGLELIALPRMAVPTHQEKPCPVGFTGEFSRVSFLLIDLLGIAAMATIARDLDFGMGARAMYPDDLRGTAGGLAVACYAVIRIRFRHSKR
jgi:hypothetical protein